MRSLDQPLFPCRSKIVITQYRVVLLVRLELAFHDVILGFCLEVGTPCWEAAADLP